MDRKAWHVGVDRSGDKPDRVSYRLWWQCCCQIRSKLLDVIIWNNRQIDTVKRIPLDPAECCLISGDCRRGENVPLWINVLFTCSGDRQGLFEFSAVILPLCSLGLCLRPRRSRKAFVMFLSGVIRVVIYLDPNISGWQLIFLFTCHIPFSFLILRTKRTPLARTFGKWYNSGVQDWIFFRTSGKRKSM